MFTFLAQLIELACHEIEQPLSDVHEVIIDQGWGCIWSVQIGNQEVFFSCRNGKPVAYHVNCYDEEVA